MDINRFIRATIEVSETIFIRLNGTGQIDENTWFAFGKTFKKKAEFEKYSDLIGQQIKQSPILAYRDYRDFDIGKSAAEEAIRFILTQIFRFLEKDQEDKQTFLLFLTAAINIYYLSGIYEAMGPFPIKDILDVITDENTQNYAKHINAYIYTRFTIAVLSSVKYMIVQQKMENEFVAQAKKIIANKSNFRLYVKKLSPILQYNSELWLPALFSIWSFHRIPPNGNYDLSKNYAELKELLDKMIEIDDQIKIPYIYQLVDQYASDPNGDYSHFKEKLGQELYDHAIGEVPLAPNRYSGNFDTSLPNAILSEFGLGIPSAYESQTQDFSNPTPYKVVNYYADAMAIRKIYTKPTN